MHGAGDDTRSADEYIRSCRRRRRRQLVAATLALPLAAVLTLLTWLGASLANFVAKPVVFGLARLCGITRRRVRCSPSRMVHSSSVCAATTPWAPLTDFVWLTLRNSCRAERARTPCLWARVHARNKAPLPQAAGEVLSWTELPPPDAATVRVVCVSDTHLRHSLVSVPWGHVLIHAGDITLRGSAMRCGRRDLAAFNRWLAALPHAHKLVIGGNHDTPLARLGPERARQLLSAATLLEHEAATVAVGARTLRVWGSPISPRSGSWNDAWQVRWGGAAGRCTGRVRPARLAGAGPCVPVLC